MHALRHVHELLVPGGTMVDLHPVTEEQVEAGGRPIGVIEEPDFVAELRNVEAALGEVMQAGLYTLEAETEFDVLEYFDEAEELLEAKDALAAQPTLIGRIRAGAPPLVSRYHSVLRRFRANSVPRLGEHARSIEQPSVRMQKAYAPTWGEISGETRVHVATRCAGFPGIFWMAGSG